MAPFKSESQRRYLWKFKPEVAKRWAEEYPNQKNLPKRKHYGDNIKKALRKEK